MNTHKYYYLRKNAQPIWFVPPPPPESEVMYNRYILSTIKIIALK